jgi:hypothetical protein
MTDAQLDVAVYAIQRQCSKFILNLRYKKWKSGIITSWLMPWRPLRYNAKIVELGVV